MCRPLVAGKIHKPPTSQIYFLSQVNFVPQGPLRDVITYPHTQQQASLLLLHAAAWPHLVPARSSQPLGLFFNTPERRARGRGQAKVDGVSDADLHEALQLAHLENFKCDGRVSCTRIA